MVPDIKFAMIQPMTSNIIIHSAPRSRNVGINSTTWLKIITLRWLEAEFNSKYDGENSFRKLQFSRSAVQFSS